MNLEPGDILTNDIGLVLEVEEPLINLIVDPSHYRTLGGIWKAVDASGGGWLVTPHSLLIAGFRKESGEDD